jgi:sialic acid synthase SpsE
MQKMVRDLKRSALALGDGEKIIYADETAPIKKMGKMIIAARDLQAGHLLNFEDLEFRSPAEGLPPSFADKVVGKVLKQDLKQHSPLTLEMFI